MEIYLANGRHVRLTCRHFGISTDHLLPVVSPLGRGARRGPTCGALFSTLACETITDRGFVAAVIVLPRRRNDERLPRLPESGEDPVELALRRARDGQCQYPVAHPG